MGARFSKLLEFEESVFNKAKREGFDVCKASHSEFLFFRNKKHTSSSESSQELKTHFHQGSFSEKLVCYGAGGRCPGAEDVEQWRKAAMEKPMPVKGDFEPILSLFTKEYFPQDEDIRGKRECLARQMSSYCQGRPQCAVVAPEMYTTEIAELPDESLYRADIRVVGVGENLYVMESGKGYFGVTHPKMRQRMSLYMYSGAGSPTWSQVWRRQWCEHHSLCLKPLYMFALAGSSQLKRLYVLGGVSHHWRHSEKIYEINPEKPESWRLVGQLEHGVYGLGAVVVHRWLYAIGGALHDRSCSRQVFALNLLKNSLVHKARMQTFRCFPAVAVHGDVIYVVGGVTDDDLNTGAEYYDVKKRQGWAWLPFPKVHRMGAALAVAAGQLWLFGGYNGKILETVEHLPLNCLQHESCEWHLHNKLMTQPRAFLTATKLSRPQKDDIFIVGGLADWSQTSWIKNAPSLVGGPYKFDWYSPRRTAEVWSLPQHQNQP